MKVPTDVNIGGLDILLLMWINQQNEIYTEGMIMDTQAKVAMGHLEIKGFDMMRGHKNEHGHDKSMFSKFHTVFSGHFHTKSDDGQIYYLGADPEIYWNDYNDTKGFHIFDTETLELTRIQKIHIECMKRFTMMIHKLHMRVMMFLNTQTSLLKLLL